MKTKSLLLGVMLTLISSLSFGATSPKTLKVAKTIKATVEKKIAVEKKVVVADCFPVSFQSDCLYISGTWCGSMADLFKIIDQFLASECP